MALILGMEDLVPQPWQNTPRRLSTRFAWKTHQLSQEKSSIREALEIMKHPHNLNRDNGMEISSSWLPLISEIKKASTHP